PRGRARRSRLSRRALPGAVPAALVARPTTDRVRLISVTNVDHLKDRIRDVPDWPEPGVVFKDIMPLLADPEALRETIDVLGDWAAEPRAGVGRAGGGRRCLIRA